MIVAFGRSGRIWLRVMVSLRPTYDFVKIPECALPKIIDFINPWGRELGRIRDLMVIHYMDLAEARAERNDQIVRKGMERFRPADAGDEDAAQHAPDHAAVEDRRECVEKGIVSDDMLHDEMRCNHVRHDAFALLERTTSLAT